VDKARAKAEDGLPLCVGASSRGSAMCMLYHCNMRNLAVIIYNVAATPDYSRPQCNYTSITSTLPFRKRRKAPFAMVSPLCALHILISVGRITVAPLSCILGIF
jgi:hypothetical protein